MKDWASKMQTQDVSKEKDWASKMSKKPMEIYDPEDTTSVMGIAKSSLVKDKDTKIKILAEERGIPPESYFEQDGELLFKGNDGKTYRESKKGALSWLKEFGVSSAVDPVGIAGGVGFTAGTAIGGPALGFAGAGLFSAIGEGIKQQFAERILDEPDRTLKEDLFDIGTSGTLGTATAFGGEKVAKIGKSVFNKIKTGKWINVKAEAALDFVKENLKQVKTEIPGFEKLFRTTEDKVAAIAISTTAKKYNIPLNLAQVTQDPRLVSMVQALEQHPKTSATTTEIISSTKKAIDEAIPTWLTEILPNANKIIKDTELSNLTPKNRLKTITDKSIKWMGKVRSDITRPFYEDALSEPPMPIYGLKESILDLTNNLSATQKPKVLRLVKDILNPSKTSKLLDKSGKTITPKLELSYALLDNIKKGLDHALYDKTATSSVDKAERIVLKEIKNLLNDTMEKNNPLYAKAKLIAASLVDPKTRSGRDLALMEEGLDNLSKKANVSLADATTYLFANKKMTPTVLNNIKSNIIGQKDGDIIWDETMNNYLNYLISSKKSIGDKTSNVGIKLYKALSNTQQQRDLWKVALGDKKYKIFQEFLDVIKSSSLTIKEDIPTSVMSSQIKEKFYSSALKAVAPLATIQSEIAKKIRSWLDNKGTEEIMKIILSPDIDTTMTKIYKTKSKSKRLEMLLPIISMVGGREATRDFSMKDVPGLNAISPR